jgi:hypothetical protein
LAALCAAALSAAALSAAALDPAALSGATLDPAFPIQDCRSDFLKNKHCREKSFSIKRCTLGL